MRIDLLRAGSDQANWLEWMEKGINPVHVSYTYTDS